MSKQQTRPEQSRPEQSREPTVERSKSTPSQSLFNIYYLGKTKVDRRCNSSMMPWIIEELKLKADEMKFIWLSPGSEGVSFVADNGQELFKHHFGNILQCCIAVDGISFAYAARQEKDKYFCHVFQALTYEDASKIMTQFKEHAQEEVLVPPTLTHSQSLSNSLSEQDVKSSGYIMSSSQNGVAMSKEEEYKLEYCGRHEVPSQAAATKDQVAIVDTLVSKMRESMHVPGGIPGGSVTTGGSTTGGVHHWGVHCWGVHCWGVLHCWGVHYSWKVPFQEEKLWFEVHNAREEQ